jgi:hypothetical protein
MSSFLVLKNQERVCMCTTRVAPNGRVCCHFGAATGFDGESGQLETVRGPEVLQPSRHRGPMPQTRTRADRIFPYCTRFPKTISDHMTTRIPSASSTTEG